jgi:glycerophosphoryl diester phosphodiesterase
MASQGVDGIITDRPGLAREVLAQRAALETHERLLIALTSLLGSDFGEEP